MSIYEYVRNNTEYSLYHGARSSSLNTFLGLSGNNVDLASTLIAMYRSIGIPARYVTGHIQLSGDQLVNWLNITNPKLAVSVLRNQGIGIIDDSDMDAIVLEHVWVEAAVNFASYRGSQSTRTCDLNTTGCQWVALDPSFKYREYPSDVTPEGKEHYRNLLKNVAFDYDAYYRAESNQQLRDKSPLEIYEEQALAYLRDNHPGVTLEDVIDEGTIIPETHGFLPSSLPYKVVGNLRRYLSVSEHDAVEATRWSKQVKVSLIPIANGVVCTSFRNSATVSVVALSTQRLTVNWGVINGRTELALRLDGTKVGGSISGNLAINCGGGLERFAIGSQFNIEVAIDGPPNENPIVVEYQNLIAGGYYLVATGGETSNWTQVQRAYQQLLDANKQYPLLRDAQNNVYVDKDKNGIINAVDNLLLDDHQAQDALTGGLLYTAQAHYYTRLKEASKRYSRLQHIVSPIAAFVGVVSTVYEVEKVDSTPFAVLPGGLLIDLKGIRLNGSWEADKPETYSSDTFKFLGHVASALEHEVWQELTGYDAVSTMRGIQFALKNDIELLDIHNTPQEDNFETSVLKMGVSAALPTGFVEHEYNMFGKRLVTYTYSGSNAQGMYVFKSDVEGIDSSDIQAINYFISTDGSFKAALENYDNIENQLINLVANENAPQTLTYNISGFNASLSVTSASVVSPSGFVVDSYQKISDSTWQFAIRETVDHGSSTKQVRVAILINGSNVASFDVNFNSSPPAFTLACDGGQQYSAIASVLLANWSQCFDNFVANNNVENFIEFFDRNKGFDSQAVLYKPEPSALEEHESDMISTIRSGMYFLSEGFTRNYTIPARLTRGPTYLFTVYIEDTFEKATGNLVSSGYIIQNQSSRLIAGGGYVPEGKGLDPANDTEAVVVTNNNGDTKLNVSQVDFNNEVFTDKNLVSIANNDVVRTPSTVDPVSTVTGNMYHDETDFVIPGKGLYYAFTRTYNSNLTTSEGPESINPNYLPFSQGWTHSYNMKLVSNDYGQYPNYGTDLAPENHNNKTSSITYIDERGGEHNYLLDDSDVAAQPTAPRTGFDELL